MKIVIRWRLKLEFDLKAALTRLSMTQKDLASQLGVTPNTVAHWNEVPGYAVAYINLLERHEAFVNRVKLALGTW